MSWEKNVLVNKPKLNNPILIAGLPGIGNVGKILVDFIKEESSAKKIVEFSSSELPHTVFVNEKNLIELPSIQLYLLKAQTRDILLLAGDAQPINESSCYDFCKEVLKILKELNCNEIITIGGIALRHVPKKPQVYCIGANKKNVTDFVHGLQIKTELYGIVGPIIGVTGVLAGLAAKRGLSAVILLAETYAHPMFLGIAGAKEILQILCKKFGLKLNLDTLSKEIKSIEDEMLLHKKEITELQQGTLAKFHGKQKKEISYIG